MRETETQNKESTHTKIPALKISVSTQFRFVNICKRPGMKISSEASKVVQSGTVALLSIKSHTLYFFKQILKPLDRRI